MESASVFPEKKQPLLCGSYFRSSLHLNFSPKICMECRQLCLLNQEVAEMPSLLSLWS